MFKIVSLWSRSQNVGCPKWSFRNFWNCPCFPVTSFETYPSLNSYWTQSIILFTNYKEEIRSVTDRSLKIYFATVHGPQECKLLVLSSQTSQKTTASYRLKLYGFYSMFLLDNVSSIRCLRCLLLWPTRMGCAHAPMCIYGYVNVPPTRIHFRR